jgi:transposase
VFSEDEMRRPTLNLVPYGLQTLYDRRLVAISEGHYPETALLRQVEGVGPLTALAFLLTLEDPYRFERSRSVGAYLGLVPARDQSMHRATKA